MKFCHFALALVFAALIVGSYAPFPGDDPRAVFNPFIVPIWYNLPRGIQ